jgi:hypothetical protein
LLVYSGWLTLIYLVCFALSFGLSRKTVLSGLCAYSLLPVAAYALKLNAGEVWGISVLAGLIVIAHHRNVADEINQVLPRRTLEPKAKPPQSL